MIDLVRFKSINENHGHVVGDHLLKQIVDRWDAIATDGAQLFRVGGDEFAIVFRGTDAKQGALSAIASLRNALVEPFFPDHQNIRIEFSVGLSVAPRDGQVADTLAAAADLALLSSKIVNGKTCWYSSELRDRAIQRHETIQDLLAADVEKDFKVFFQPIIDLKTGAIVKVEALLRWAHPRHGLLLPSNFIEALCSLNRSRAVGRRILEEACAITASWNRRFSLNLIVSVNAFPLQLVDPDFPKDVQAALSKSDLPAGCLEIEVTENIALEGDSYSRTVLQQLSDMSVAISLDDFGTGFASLSSLTQLKIQTLKIDRSFAVNLSPNDPRMVILKATRLMTNGLGIRTVVEGIENVNVARIAFDLGFDYGQGYFWSLPIDPTAFSKLLTSQQVMHLFSNPTAS
jgi:diguanylate cyclase (GGDEF)-like protein